LHADNDDADGWEFRWRFFSTGDVLLMVQNSPTYVKNIRPLKIVYTVI